MKHLFLILVLFFRFNSLAQTNSVDDNHVSKIIPESENDNSYKTLKALKDLIRSSEKPHYSIDTSVINELNRFALTCIANRELKNAEGFFTLSVKQSQKQNYWKGLADGLYAKGEYQILEGLPDSAIYNLECAKIYYQFINDARGIYKSGDAIASAYFTKGDYFLAHTAMELNGKKLTVFDTDSVLFFGLYLGALLFCFIYNIFLYRFTQDQSYRELAKCIFAFIIYIYTTNNDFACHFFTNLKEVTILELFKTNSIFFSTFYFATFIENLLKPKKGVLTRFYHFLRVYKKTVTKWAILANIIVLFLMYYKHTNTYDYFGLFKVWWAWNVLIGLIATITFFTALFVLTFKKKIKLNYLIYGFTFNILFLSLAFAQTAIENKFSHIPNPHALGSVIFLIFMTVAITDKINQYRKETEDAQENALKHLEKVVTERTLDLKQQKEVVEEKNKEITDSITYAKRLQQAILPPLQFIKQHFSESFIVYKPKDIVAGDFYWCEAVNAWSSVGSKQTSGAEKTPTAGTILIAVADCTGHGVPGAMVSVVCSNALNRTVKEFGIIDPGKVLDKTRELVLETFERSESEVKDGMDISLLCINEKTKKVFWSGANNPLWYIQDNELKEIKPDKQPIGKTEYPKPFTTHEINYTKDTIFYLLSDGLSDQFGGAKGKKFKHKQLKEILLSTASLSLKQQSSLISEKFDNWKGNLEQVDDVCIIGIRL